MRSNLSWGSRRSSSSATAAGSNRSHDQPMRSSAAKSITLKTSRPVAPSTLSPDAVSVTDYDDADGWSNLDIKAVSVSGDGSIKIDLKEAPAGSLVRLIISGTGPRPLLAADNHIALGAPGAGGADDGVDFVKMFTRS